MATRIADILTRVRDSLADPNKERWSDDRLLRLLDEGQKHFAREARLLKSSTTLPIVQGQALYALPDTCWLITRVSLGGKAIPLQSFDGLDETTPYWYTETGPAIKSAVFNRREPNTLRLYPILDGSSSEYSYSVANEGYVQPFEVTGDAFGVVVEIADTVSVDSSDAFGVIQSIAGVERVELSSTSSNVGTVVAIDDFTATSPYGIVTSIYSPDVLATADTPYGVITAIYEDATPLFVQYIKDPETLRSIEAELEVAGRWDTALKSYVIGQAYRDDLDTANRSLGNEWLQLYARELDVAKKADSSDSTMATQYEIKYRSAF